ncbi:MAG: septum site-determining protein MinC [Desulfotalea sp.]
MKIPPTQFTTNIMNEPFQFKAHRQTMMVLYILSTNDENFFNLLKDRLKKAKTFFTKAPIVIDISKFAGEIDPQVLGGVFVLLQEAGLSPLGIQGCSEKHKDIFTSAGFIILPDAESDSGKVINVDTQEVCKGADNCTHLPDQTIVQPPEPEVVIEKILVPPPPALLIDQPVRSGVRIQSDGDIICTASISDGAELAAKGNIHIYGVLRGRAFAGNTGDKNANILCNKLDAQLVSIAGVYRLCENFDEKLINKATHISLLDDRLNFKLI